MRRVCTGAWAKGLSRGATCSSHMRFISRGTPGNRMTRLPG